jgi:hypothetical protein
MAGKVFIAAVRDGLARAYEAQAGRWDVESVLPGVQVNCLGADPLNPEAVYAGTEHDGLMRSCDRGKTWQRVGLEGKVVKSVAVSPTTAGTIYAGVRPAGVLVSSDNGGSWSELAGFRKVKEFFWFSPASPPFTAYVQSIVLPSARPGTVVAGIELGGVVVSTDGGQTWMRHRRGALRDCHMLFAHPTDGRWVYEAGGTGGGAAVSTDGGLTWHKHSKGLDRHYGWAVCADATRPDVWYVSRSPGPGKAHDESKGQAEAYIFRSMGGRPWEKLGGGLPQPLNYMPYAILTSPNEPGRVYAGLSNGDVWHSPDQGDTWERLPLRMPGNNRPMIRP